MNFFNKFNKLTKRKTDYKKILMGLVIVVFCIVLIVLNQNKSRAIFKFTGTGTTINSIVSGEVITFPSELILYEKGMSAISVDSNKWQFENAEFLTGSFDDKELATYDSNNGIVINPTSEYNQWVALSFYENVNLTEQLNIYETINFEIQMSSGVLSVFLADNTSSWNSGTRLTNISSNIVYSISTNDIKNNNYIFLVGYMLDETNAKITKIWFN